MKKISTLLFALVFGLGLAAQTPCIDGMANGYPCNGVSMMSHLSIDDIGGATGINDIWGWTDFDHCKEYAIVGKENGTAFVDITDPLAPCYLGTLPTHTDISTWRDIKVYNNYAFIVSEASGHGMQVFDLTRLRNVTDVPTTFDADAHFDGFGNSHNIVINPETGYAYPVGTGFFSGGSHFINIQDPLNPVAEGGYDGSGYTHDAQVIVYNGPDTEHVGKEIYIGSNASTGVVLVDVSDKTDPELLSTTPYENLVYTHQGWITPDHRYILINDEIDEGTFGYNTRTRVFDALDLDNLVEMSFFSAPITSTDHNHYIKGDYCFQSNYTGGLRILDLSDIANDNISETAYFDVHPNDDNSGYSGTWSNYPYFSSGNVIVTHRQDGLFIVRPDDAAIRSATDAIYTEDCDGVVGEGDSQITLCTVIDGVTESGARAFDIFPNPAQAQLHITAEETFERIELLDVTGKVLRLQMLTTPTAYYLLDLAEMAPGIYTLRLDGQNGATQLLSITR